MVSVFGALALLAGLLTTGITAPQAAAQATSGPVRNGHGWCLENANGTARAGNPQRIVACASTAAQAFSRFSDGTLRVQGLCLDLQGGATRANTPVVLAVCSAGTSQRWTIETNTGYVRNQRSNTCLAPFGNRATAGEAAIITSCAPVPGYRWTVPALAGSGPPATTTPRPTTTTPRPTTTTPRPTTTTPRPTTTTPRPTTTTPRPTTTTPRPTTTTPPPTTPSTPPGQTTQRWDSDFTGSGFGRFDDTPWNNVGADAPVIVNSPVTSGAKAARFTMPGGGQRSEIVPSTAVFSEGQDRYFRYSFYLPAGFPTQVTTWQVITQWKNDGTGSPPLELTVGRGNINLSGGYGHPAGPKHFSVPVTAATTGQRIDLVVHVFFSRDPNKGVVDVWRNGTKVLNAYKPAGGTLYPTKAGASSSLNSYWKMGLYRDTAISQQGQYTIESAKIGNTFEQVAN